MIQHHIIRHSDRNKHIKLNNLTTKPIKERSNYIRYRLIEKKMILIPSAQCNEILNHSLEKRGLRSTFLSSEMLQNLLYL